MIAGAMARIDAWIFEEYRASTMDLAIFRIIYALFMLLHVPPVAPWIGRAPHAFSRLRSAWQLCFPTSLPLGW